MYPQGTVFDLEGRQSACIPPVDLVAEGVLYLTPAPNRVVALVEAHREMHGAGAGGVAGLGLAARPDGGPIRRSGCPVPPNGGPR
jgi:hypothetical protein